MRVSDDFIKQLRFVIATKEDRRMLEVKREQPAIRRFVPFHARAGGFAAAEVGFERVDLIEDFNKALVGVAEVGEQSQVGFRAVFGLKLNEVFGAGCRIVFCAAVIPDISVAEAGEGPLAAFCGVPGGEAEQEALERFLEIGRQHGFR